MLFEPIGNQSEFTHKINSRHKAKHIKIRLYDEILMVYRQLKAQSLNTLQFLWCELTGPRVGSLVPIFSFCLQGKFTPGYKRSDRIQIKSSTLS
jgi:hypothetical protein